MIPHLRITRAGARFMGRAFPCAVGRAGIGLKRGEGDNITPLGRHRLESVLIRPDRPAGQAAAAFRAGPLQIIGRADGWSDDPADPAYNTAVRLPHRFGHERLRRADRQYDIVGVLDWNRGPIIPGAGSAIFLHIWRGPRRPTAGCVAFDARDLLWILARWRPESRVVIG